MTRAQRRIVISRRRRAAKLTACALSMLSFAAGAGVALSSSDLPPASAATRTRPRSTAAVRPASTLSPAPAIAPAAGVTTTTPSPVSSVSISCASPSLGGTLPAIVYLPAGYATGTQRYPVVYFLHGLPANPGTYTEDGFVAGALAGAHERAIVVAPQGARSAGSDREYLDWGPTENWPAAIATDLTACIDHRFRTIADRDGRLLAGLSAGGFGAFNIGLRNLAVFGAVESWSGYFVATDPSGLHVLTLPSPTAQAAATVLRGAALRAALTASPTLIAFYVGDQDSRFLAMNRQFDAELTASGIAHTFSVYPGGHSETLWHAQAPRWLSLALGYLAAARASS